MKKIITCFSLFFTTLITTAQVGKELQDNKIKEWLIENNIPVLGLGIIKGGKLEEIKVFGELIKGTPAPSNTIFNVASLTKPVTAVVALKLVSLGKWDLDEPIYKYWTDPDVASDPRIIANIC